MILGNNEITDLLRSGVVRTSPGSAVAVDIVSVTLHLDNSFLTYREYSEPVVPPADLPTELTRVDDGDAFVLPPGGRVLACTAEMIDMPLDLMGFVQTKGSLARGFLMVHMCDGQIDPGFRGKITLELANLSGFHYKLVPGMPIAQLLFAELVSPVSQGYDGRYNQADVPVAMRSDKHEPDEEQT